MTSKFLTFRFIVSTPDSGRRDIVDDGVQPEVGVLPDAPGLVPRRPARRHGPRRREGQQAAGLRPRPRRLDQGQDSGRGQQKKDRMKSDICMVGEGSLTTFGASNHDFE